MQNIPFEEFFDTHTAHKLFTGLELISSYEFNYEDRAYLLGNGDGTKYYVVIETDTSADLDEMNDWTQQNLNNQSISLIEIPPMNTDYDGEYYLYRVVFEN